MTTEHTEAVEPKLKKLDTLWWAVALIWAGLVFGAESLDFLPQIADASVWSWIFLGAGLFGLVLNFFSLSADNYQDPTTWDWIWSGGLTLVGAAAFVAFDFPWWLVLIVLGGAILISALRKQD